MQLKPPLLTIKINKVSNQSAVEITALYQFKDQNMSITLTEKAAQRVRTFLEIVEKASVYA